MTPPRCSARPAVAPRCSISPVARSNSSRPYERRGRPLWRTSIACQPADEKGCRSGLIQPERVEPDDVVDAEIIFRVVALHVVVPDIEDIFPRNWHQWRILLHDVLGLPDQRHALAAISFDVDLIDQF